MSLADEITAALACASLVLSLLALAWRAGGRETQAEDALKKLATDLNGVAANGRKLSGLCDRQYRKIVRAIVLVAPSRDAKDEAVRILLDRE